VCGEGGIQKGVKANSFQTITAFRQKKGKKPNGSCVSPYRGVWKGQNLPGFCKNFKAMGNATMAAIKGRKKDEEKDLLCGLVLTGSLRRTLMAGLGEERRGEA